MNSSFRALPFFFPLPCDNVSTLMDGNGFLSRCTFTFFFLLLLPILSLLLSLRFCFPWYSPRSIFPSYHGAVRRATEAGGDKKRCVFNSRAKRRDVVLQMSEPSTSSFALPCFFFFFSCIRTRREEMMRMRPVTLIA
uniref:Uncharacterized protein n=1 Tax=Trypanosoma congolense (strain IL3000) TaxID=1068625 RepID=G0UMP6_TRYCI|nr:hypothetical protein, unlikely [Trypanosoma congolense IL3000]